MSDHQMQLDELLQRAFRYALSLTHDRLSLAKTLYCWLYKDLRLVVIARIPPSLTG